MSVWNQSRPPGRQKFFYESRSRIFQARFIDKADVEEPCSTSEAEGTETPKTPVYVNEDDFLDLFYGGELQEIDSHFVKLAGTLAGTKIFILYCF